MLYLRATTAATVFAKVANQLAALRRDGPSGRRCGADTRKQQRAIRANPWGRRANENRWICPNKWGESLLWISGSSSSREEGSTLPLVCFPFKMSPRWFLFSWKNKKTMCPKKTTKDITATLSNLILQYIVCERFTIPQIEMSSSIKTTDHH